MKRYAALLLLVAVLAGCGSGGSPKPTPTVTVTAEAGSFPGGTVSRCVGALHKADAAFTRFGQDLSVLKRAFDAFANHNFTKATAILHAAPAPPDVAGYKGAEALCLGDLGR